MNRLTDTERQMVADNLGLAGWAVQRWARHLPIDGNGYTQADAYQDAVFGLARAVQGYDPTTGFTFATYAAPHLRAAIQGGMGRHEGVNHRRDVAATVKGALTAERLTSLDAPPPFISDGDPDTLAARLADPHDHESDMAAAVLRADLEAHRHQLCCDGIDHALLDALLDPAIDWSTPIQATVLVPIAETHGVHGVTVRKRLNKLRERIATHLDHTPTKQPRTERMPRAEAQRRVIDALTRRTYTGPTALAQLANVAGLTENQARWALRALRATGTVTWTTNGRHTVAIALTTEQAAS